MMKALTSRISIALLGFVIGIAAAGVGRVLSSSVIKGTTKASVKISVPKLPAKASEMKSEPAQAETEWEPPQSSRHTAQVLEVGEYHGDEVKARTGERWLGLYVTNRGTRLDESVLKVTAVRDEIVDGKENSITGKRVSVNRRPEPVLLVKGVRNLHTGAVGTVFLGETKLGTGTDLHLKLNGIIYNLYVKTSDTNYGSFISRDDAKLILRKDEDENSEQVLYDLGGQGGAAEAYWQLLWAGDMNGDNELDLYVQVSHHYNVSQRKLFLSSQAKRGTLVREVAELFTVGC